MIELDNVQAEAIRLNVVLVSWRIRDTQEDIGRFHFRVTRANSPGGPFEAISPDLVNIFQFFDTTEQMKSNYRKFYYQLVVRDSQTGQEILSPVASLDAPPDFFVLELRRRHVHVYLRRFVGIPAAILIARSFGQRCPQCFDQVKMRQKTSRCLSCFNMGYVGGFYPQVNTYINWNPNPELVQLLETGESHPVQTSLWMGDFPLLSPRDMIVEFPENRRWRVVSTGKTERRRATSRQIAQVVEVNRNDVEYEYPVQKYVPAPDVFLGFYPPSGSGLL